MSVLFGIFCGFMAWFLLNYLLAGLYTVDQNERAVKTVFGRAERLEGKSTLDDPEMSATLNADEKERYNYPQLLVIPPGGPYFKWPWERVYTVSVATQSVNIGYDAEAPEGSQGERNLHAPNLGIRAPIIHVMGSFVSVLREKIVTFEAPKTAASAALVANTQA